MHEKIIEAMNVSKTYHTGGTINKVISHLDLTINKGEFTVIMGRSGSGKSTLLYLLSGLDQVSEGQIFFCEKAVHDKSEKDLALLRRDKIGFVFQHANLVPNLSILENILVAGYLMPGNKKEIYNRSISLLQQTGLMGLENRFPSQLSGGEQHRAAIVRALINNPRLLMADEPTGNLNSRTSEQVLDVLSSFHSSGQTILMVTHDIKSACRGQRILFFNDGKIVDEVIPEKGLPGEKKEKMLATWLLERGW